ncbi:MAG: LamG-like jellyroll fold domain-containing protein, partial [bacterium]
ESPDTLHPNEYGYAKMANGWYQELVNPLPTPPIVCANGISHYWRMEKEIPAYVDNVGYSVVYAPNPPNQVDGIVNKAQQYSGAQETSVRDDDSFDWGLTDSFSLEFWMKKDIPVGGTAVQDNEVILGRDDPSTQLHWWFGVAATASPSGAACFQLRDAAHNGGAIYGTTDLDDGAWHHVVATRDGVGNWNRLYVDGYLEGEDQFTYATGFTADGTLLDIGWLNLPDYYHYNGILDEVAIFNRELLDTEILEHYTNGLVGKGYCNGGEVAPTITTSPVIDARVGILYSYNVNAIGYPAPTFALNSGPAGMTIDPATGLLQWIPPDTTDAEVTVEALNSEGSDYQTFTIVVEEAPDCPVDMVAYWQLDETSGTTYTDYYDAHDANASTTPPSPDPDGIVGSSQSFNGTNNWIDVPDDPDFDWLATSSFTVELWAKFTNVSTRNKVMIGRDQGGGSPHWWLGAQQSSGLVVFNLRDSSNNGIACTGGTAVNDGLWHHIVAVRDESLNQNRIYVDGDLEDTQTYDYGAGFGASTPIGIGYMAYNYNPDYYYDGLLDEIALYSRDLTEAEIDDHYAAGLAGSGYCQMEPAAPSIVSTPVTTAIQGMAYTYDVDATGHPAPIYALTTSPAGMTIDMFSGLIEWTPPDTNDVTVTVEATNTAKGVDSQTFVIEVAEAPDCPPSMLSYWKLDETGGSTYEDFLGGNNASSGSLPTPVTGQVGGAQEFNGSSHQINAPSSSLYNWGNNDSFSIEYWLQTPSSSTAAGNEVCVGRDDGGNSLHWWTGAWDGGVASFILIATNGDGSGSENYLYGTTDLTDGGWHHVVAVRDAGTGYNRLYVDGAEEDSHPVSYGAGGSFGSSSAPIQMGWLNLGGGYYFQGTLDEVAILSDALSPTEVLAHYQQGLAGLGYCEQVEAPPVIISSPVTDATVGLPYSYDVDASGYPAPTYALTTAPAGMTIDPASGLIQWTPPDTTDASVTVEATNTAKGVDSQSFTIVVEEAPPCPP